MLDSITEIYSDIASLHTMAACLERSVPEGPDAVELIRGISLALAEIERKAEGLLDSVS